MRESADFSNYFGKDLGFLNIYHLHKVANLSRKRIARNWTKILKREEIASTDSFRGYSEILKIFHWCPCSKCSSDDMIHNNIPLSALLQYQKNLMRGILTALGTTGKYIILLYFYLTQVFHSAFGNRRYQILKDLPGT